MEKGDKGSTLTRMGVSGWMFLLVPAYPGCPGKMAVKWLLLSSLFPLLTDMLPGRSTSEVMILWHYTNLFIIILTRRRLHNQNYIMYHHAARRGLSHGHWNALKCTEILLNVGHVVSEICLWTDRLTDRTTHDSTVLPFCLSRVKILRYNFVDKCSHLVCCWSHVI